MLTAGRIENTINRGPNDPFSIHHLGAIGQYTSMAPGLAARDFDPSGEPGPFARLLAGLDDRQATRKYIESNGNDELKDYFLMGQAAQLPLNKTLEYMTMSGIDPLARSRELDIYRPGARRGVVPPPVGITFTVDPRAFPDSARWPLQGVRPGETITLNPWQVHVLYQIRNVLRRLWEQGAVDTAKRFGYDGPILSMGHDGQYHLDEDLVRQNYETEGDPIKKKAAERALTIVHNAIFNQRGKTYFPLYREGDWEARVTPRVPLAGTGHASAHETWVMRENSIGPLDVINGLRTTIGGPSKRILDWQDRIRAQFPASDYTVDFRQVKPPLHQRVNLAELDALLKDPLVNPDTGERLDTLKEAVIHQAFLRSAAGFLQPREGYAGYSMDMPKALSNYIRQAAYRSANALHGDKIDSAYLDSQAHPDRNYRRYARNYMDYQNKGQDHPFWQTLNNIGFFKVLWGNPSSAVVQLFHTPISTGSQLGIGVGALRGQVMANQALALAMRAISADPTRGLYIDIHKLAPHLSPAEYQALQRAAKEGRLDPVTTRYLQGASIASRLRGTPVGRAINRIYEYGSSMMSAVDQANRIAAYIAYYRAAHLPGAPERFLRAYGRDALFMQQVAPLPPIRFGEEGRIPARIAGPAPPGVRIDPVKLANWGVNETNFMSHQMGAAPIQRGAGSAAFQFQHVTSNYLRLLYKNFTRMGPQGKAAGVMMLGAIIGASGLMGLPFANDIERMGSAVTKLITGIDPMIDYKLRELMSDNAFSRFSDDLWGWEPGTTGEMLMEGPSRQLFGVDFGRRVGLGNLLPSDPNIFQAVPVLQATFGAAMEAAKRWGSNQPVGAAAALLPAPLENMLKAFEWGQTGVQGQTPGNVYLPPSQVTPGMQIARGLGFQPAAVARIETQKGAAISAEAARKDEYNRVLGNIATQFALYQDARRSGNRDRAQVYLDNFHSLIDQYNDQIRDRTLPAWQRMPRLTARAIRMRSFHILNPLGLSPTQRRQGMGTFVNPYRGP